MLVPLFLGGCGGGGEGGGSEGDAEAVAGEDSVAVDSAAQAPVVIRAAMPDFPEVEAGQLAALTSTRQEEYLFSGSWDATAGRCREPSLIQVLAQGEGLGVILLFGPSRNADEVGEYEVEGRVINRFDQGMMPFGNADGEDYQSEQMPPETVERWACVPGCPVRALDDQAGETTSPGHPVIKRETAAGYQGMTYGKESRAAGTEMITYGDTGGPSRFFYTAKASRGEKDKGLENFYWKRTDEGFERINLSEYEQLDKRERARGCIHPTVKPIELLRYLSTLSLPPKQEGKTRRILIPFSGSGSEMIGATQAGWDEVIGVEMEQNYIEMAEARLNANIGMF
ncbi:MAG: hypothetical protein IID05_04295 [Gemmatimonadetes bacterium]|nr:hypothetical protein [Gemmatimonadota bacterium]